jgi:hypothetical protein
MNLLTTLFAASLLAGAQHPTMPKGMSHERAARAMGFDQDTTVHHFRLSPAGGSIQVEVKDPADSATRTQIRTHLRGIADQFARGDFAKPLATHAEVPPGVAVMQQRKAAIAYRYEDTQRGARIVVDTTDAVALRAIHDFLRYQIAEHKTGDSTVAKD